MVPTPYVHANVAQMFIHFSATSSKKEAQEAKSVSETKADKVAEKKSTIDDEPTAATTSGKKGTGKGSAAKGKVRN